MRRLTLLRDDKGAATIELAFAFPILIMFIYAFFQFALIYRAVAGIQQGLGQGARYATLCLSPTLTGCTPPTAANIKTTIENTVYGIGPGTFQVPTPTLTTAGTGKYYDLTVNYTQPTSLLFLPGPTISVSRSKRVWVAGS